MDAGGLEGLAAGSQQEHCTSQKRPRHSPYGTQSRLMPSHNNEARSRYRDVWQHAQFTYRKSVSLWRSGVLLLIGTINLAVALSLIFMPGGNADSFLPLLGGVLTIIACTALYAGISLAYSWLCDRIDSLEISSAGIQYGRSKWAWEEISAVNFTLADQRSTTPHIRIWTKADKNWPHGGHPLLVDECLSSNKLADVRAKLNHMVDNSGIRITCD